MNEDGSSSSGQYNFNLLFFKRFYYLHKIFFPGLKNVLGRPQFDLLVEFLIHNHLNIRLKAFFSIIHIIYFFNDECKSDMQNNTHKSF